MSSEMSLEQLICLFFLWDEHVPFAHPFLLSSSYSSLLIAAHPDYQLNPLQFKCSKIIA
jgi:hypothetical protein